MTEITTVGVLGCGLMGGGIAQTAAAAGFNTTVRDVSEALLERGRNAIARSLAKLVEKAKLDSAARDGAVERLSFTTELDDLRGSDIVIDCNGFHIAPTGAFVGPLRVYQHEQADATLMGGVGEILQDDPRLANISQPIPSIPL